ncbi:MAG TPA: alkaline phosphatase family protein [Streptosporangiaceae bacterium]|jgi:hypothetical protein
MPFLQSRRARAAAIVVSAAGLLAGLALPVAASAAASQAAGSAPAAASSHTASHAASQVPRYRHIAVIMFADHGYSAISHNKFAPTFNRLAAKYGLATHYDTTADPDTAGIMSLLAGNSFGVSDDVPYWDQQISKPSLLSQLDAAHKSWKEYVQDMPYAGYLGNCYPTNCQETDSLYNQAKFNPVPDLSSVADNPAEARKMVPASKLAADAHNGRLPNFSFIDTNECANMHGGPPWCEDSSNDLGQPNDNKLVAGGDSYLRQVTHEIMSGPQWQHGNNAIVVTWTEGTTSAGCCDAKPGTGRVFTIVVTSHGPRHLTDRTPFNHYSLLSTIQHAFGLSCLQFTCDTRHVLPMTRLFGGKSDGQAGFHGTSATAGPVISKAPARAAPHPAASAAASKWQQVRSPNTGSNDNDLASVAGRSPSDIWAVGSLLPDANATIVRTLALHYNGARWARVRTPDVGAEANSLYGVAALPDGTAWATGIFTQASGHTGRALTMHWNGHRWAIVPGADPGSAEDMLSSVTAVSDRDVWAVGTYSGHDGFFHPLIEHWNGVRWTVRHVRGLAVPDGILTSVTSSGGRDVWAAGQLSGPRSDRQVVLHLVRGTWAVSPSPAVRTPGGSVADAYPASIAVSARGPWLAGNDRAGHSGFSTLVEGPASSGRLRQLDPSNPTPQDNYLQAVAPVDGGRDAWAAGDSVPPSTGSAASLIEHGSAAGGWKAVPSPNPGAANGNTILDGLVAFSASNIWAVGTFDGKGGMRTLILHFTG